LVSLGDWTQIMVVSVGVSSGTVRFSSAWPNDTWNWRTAHAGYDSETGKFFVEKWVDTGNSKTTSDAVQYRASSAASATTFYTGLITAQVGKELRIKVDGEPDYQTVTLPDDPPYEDEYP